MRCREKSAGVEGIEGWQFERREVSAVDEEAEDWSASKFIDLIVTTLLCLVVIKIGETLLIADY